MDIDIPKAPRFPGPIPGQIERVSLPLVATTHLTLFARLWIFVSAILAAVLVTPFIALAFASPTPSRFGVVQSILLVLAAMFSGSFGLTMIAAIATLIVDSMRQSTLVIDGERFFDNRSIRSPIPWAEISEARIAYQAPYHRGGDVFGVRLTFRRAIKAFQNPFRLGALGFCWRRRTNELYVPLLHFTAAPHTQGHRIVAHNIGHAILALVKMHGGKTEA